MPKIFALQTQLQAVHDLLSSSDSGSDDPFQKSQKALPNYGPCDPSPYVGESSQLFDSPLSSTYLGVCSLVQHPSAVWSEQPHPAIQETQTISGVEPISRVCAKITIIEGKKMTLNHWILMRKWDVNVGGKGQLLSFVLISCHQGNQRRSNICIQVLLYYPKRATFYSKGLTIKLQTL